MTSLEPSKPYYVFKICLLGQARIGKTCLAKRLCFDLFDGNTKLTIGLDFYSYDIGCIINDEEKFIRISLWDFGTQERFRELFPYYITGANGIFLVYDLTNYQSLHNLGWWHEQLKDLNMSEVPKILLGTKFDLIDPEPNNNQRFSDKTESYMKMSNISKVIKTSSKEDVNVLFSFKELIKEILKFYNLPFDKID